MNEIQPDEMCPCGRGKKYKECCKKSGITWYRKEDGTYVKKYQVAIPEEIAEMLEETRDRFYDLFGREPLGDDRIAFDVPCHSNAYFKTLLPCLREAGVPEEWIYATYRMDGLVPMEANEKYISQHDLDLFFEYVEEYEEILYEVRQAEDGALNDESYISVAALVMIGSEAIDRRIQETAESLLHGLNYFLNYTNRIGGSVKASPNSLTEYASYIAIRTCKTIDSILNLHGIDEPGSIYALGRSLFESYMYLRAINSDKLFFETSILPSLSFSECGFQIENGTVQYKKIKAGSLFGPEAPRRRRRDEPNFGGTCKKYGTGTDEKLRTIFYRYACQFVHIDPLTARSVFYEPDLYLEFSESSIAAACSLSMATVLLEEIAKLDITQEQRRADLQFLVGNLAESLSDCFKSFVLGDEQSDEMYELFLQRLLEIEQLRLEDA